MDENITRGLGFLVTLLLLLWARRRKKEEQRKNDPTIPPYETIEPESRNYIDQAVTGISKVFGIYNVAMSLFLLGAVAYLFFVDSITRWIILGTAALIIVIILIHKRMKARQDNKIDAIDRGED